MRRFPKAIMVLLLLAAPLGAPGAWAAAPPPVKFVVFFQEWSAVIDDAALGAITAASEFAHQHATQPIVVAGFADPTGSAEANDLLSKLRAQRVIDQLIDDGVAKARIRRIGHGSQDFSLTSQESRRVEISVGGR